MYLQVSCVQGKLVGVGDCDCRQLHILSFSKLNWRRSLVKREKFAELGADLDRARYALAVEAYIELCAPNRSVSGLL